MARPRPADPAREGPSLRIVVAGASRGLGLEFARQWMAAGERVFALARDPSGSDGLRRLQEEYVEQLTPVRCDVAEDDSVERARRAVADVTDGLDVLLNVAGVMGDRARLGDLDFGSIERVFEINALGPLRVSQAFLPLLKKGRRPARVVHLTSLMGSIADNRSGGSYAYRLSKAALNMTSRNLAHDLRGDGIISVVLHPGWVATDMGGPGARLSVNEAVGSLIATIESLGVEQSGGFYDRQGEPLPW